uniref:Taste receptor type 2 n=1 Tax=Romanomermis culicivorax TaxID=13658 RepID=A0A915IY17_ROMCU
MMDNETSIQQYIIGGLYLLMSGAGFVGNGICCATLIIKKLHQKNSAYFFMANQCVADILCLLGVGMYVGLVLIFGQMPNIHRIMSMCFQVGWWTSGYFSIGLATTRLFSLKYNEQYLQETYFFAVVTWLCPFFLSFTFALHPTPINGVFRDKFTTGIFVTDTMSRILFCFNFLHDFVVSNAILVINTLTGLFVRKVSVQVASSLQHTQTRSLEIKLFAQCLTTTSILMVICYIYCVVYFVGYTLDVIEFFIFHFGWILYHSICPFVYLMTNGELRNLVKQILSSTE